MAQLLAIGKTEPNVHDHTADLDISGAALNSLLPDRTGFQLLIQPLRARGLGLRLKRKRLFCIVAFVYTLLLGQHGQLSACYWCHSSDANQCYPFNSMQKHAVYAKTLGMIFRWRFEEPLSDCPAGSRFSLSHHRPVAPHDSV